MTKPLVIEKTPMPDFSPVEISAEDAAVFEKPPVWQADAKGYQLIPETALQVVQYLSLASQRKFPLAFSPSHTDQLRIPLWMNLSSLNHVRNYHAPDLTITMESGMRFGEFQNTLNAQGQYFPLQYPDDTLLVDLFAEDRPAAETPFYGYPRDYVLGLEIATPDGRLTKCGGQVVKNVTGYDLNKLYVGSLNTLGIITSLTLKVFPSPPVTRSLRIALASLDAAPAFASHLQGLPIAHCVVEQRHQQRPSLNVTLAGYKGAVSAAQAHLESCVSSSHSIERISTGHSPVDIRQPQGIVVELSPVQQAVQRLLQFLDSSHPIKPDLIQYLPLANLVYVHWFAESTRLWNEPEFRVFLEACIHHCRDADGVTLLQVPDALQSFLAVYNLPSDPTNLLWQGKLKKLYDPQAILSNPYFPISAT